jgi:hypothetical protein
MMDVSFILNAASIFIPLALSASELPTLLKADTYTSIQVTTGSEEDNLGEKPAHFALLDNDGNRIAQRGPTKHDTVLSMAI